MCVMGLGCIVSFFVLGVRDVECSFLTTELARKHKLPAVAETRDLATRNFKRRVKTILESVSRGWDPFTRQS